jgi:c-di-GMP-binding flagellar brake protein YcgR
MTERRLHQRFQKPYTVIFSLKDTPRETYDISTVLDISRGGLKFVSSDNYPAGTKIVLKIKFPFLYPKETLIDGEVVDIDQGAKAKLSKIKVKFINISPPVESILQQMEELNLKDKRQNRPS